MTAFFLKRSNFRQEEQKMKKTIIFAAVAAMFSLASCQKAELVSNETTSSPVFTASINQGSKTAVDVSSGKVSWEVGDKVSITDAASNVAVYEVSSVAASGVATLTKTSGNDLGDGPYTATYGSKPSISQTYSATAGQLYMESGKSETTNLTFAVKCGLLKLNLVKSGESVKSIAVTGKTTGSNMEQTFTLTCSEPQSIESAKDFYIALPAGTYNKIVIVNTDAATCTLNSAAGTAIAVNNIKSVTLDAGKVAFKPIDIPSGAIHVLQEGQTAKDATEIAFADLLSYLAAVNNQAAYDYLNGKTFYFDAATYKMVKPSPEFCNMSSPCVVRFIGKGTTLEASGDSSSSQRQHFSIKCNCDFTFENFNFTNASASGNKNGASFWVGCDKERPMTAKLTVKNCTFSNCSASNGPCLFAKNNSDITAEGCTFLNCNGEGGAIGGDTSRKTINVTVKDCTFRGCTTGSYGGAIEARKYTTCTITGCKFYNCSASKHGSAIAIGTNGGALSESAVIDNCYFEGCNGSEVIFVNDALKKSLVSNCEFRDCAGGSAGVIGSAVELWASHLKFIGNTIPDGTIIGANKPLYVDNVVVYGNTATAATGTLFDTPDVLFIGNTTAIQNMAGGMASSGTFTILYNNILFNTAENGIVVPSAAAEQYMGGYNIFGPVTTGLALDPSDKTIASLSALKNGAWDASKGHYIWDGPDAASAKMGAAAYTGFIEGTAGTEFDLWLKSLDANTARGADNWWPGAYQK